MRLTLPIALLAAGLSAPASSAEVVPLPGFRSVELRGGGEIAVTRGPVERVTILEGSTRFTRMWVERGGRLRIDACNAHCPRVYRLRIAIESPRVPDLAISGGGKIRASGFAPQSQISAAVNGGGQIDLRAIDATDVSAAVNGGGQIQVRARRSLSAAVSGGGAIRYLGSPQVSMAVHGGGVVQPGN